MAQDIIIAGAQYPEVPAINIPKTAGGTALFVDTSEDTITAEKLRSGITAHDKSGEKITGTLPDVTQATPVITVSAAGLITASATQDAGVVAAGTKSDTHPLVTVAAKTIYPATFEQKAVAALRFTTGDVKVAAVFAVIGVLYPAGSTVTCTHGTTTLTAGDTSGRAMFIIPEAGTWTVKAVSGNKSVSKAVSITVAGQVETVTLIYELILFDNGIINDIKWDANDRSGDAGDSTSSVSNKISLVAYGYWDGNYYSADATRGTSDSFDLSKYSTLKVQVSAVNSFGQRRVYIGTTALKHDVATIDVSNTGIVACDISAINSQCFVSFYVSTGGQNENGTASLDVTKVWLE